MYQLLLYFLLHSVCSTSYSTYFFFVLVQLFIITRVFTKVLYLVNDYSNVLLVVWLLVVVFLVELSELLDPVLEILVVPDISS